MKRFSNIVTYPLTSFCGLLIAFDWVLQVLIDGPQKTTGIHRQTYLLKRLALTDIVVKIGKNASQKKLEGAWSSEGVMGKWEATAWAKKLASKKKRAALSDFDRFKVMVAKKQRAKAAK